MVIDWSTPRNRIIKEFCEALNLKPADNFDPEQSLELTIDAASGIASATTALVDQLPLVEPIKDKVLALEQERVRQ